MADSKAKKGPIRIPDWLLESLKDEQYDLRKATGKEPPYGELLAARMRRLETLEAGGAPHPDSSPSPYPGREHWHDMLDRILTRGTDRQQLGIQSNLEAFDANLAPPHQKRRAM